MFALEQALAYLKSLFSGFLALFVSISNFFGWYADVGGVHGLRTDYAYTFAYSTEKIQPEDILGKKDTIRVLMGKNEREGFQFVARLRYSNQVNYVLQLSDITGPGGATIPAAIYKECYTYAGPPVQSGDFPDALIPYTGKADVLARRVNQGFYFELRTGEDTPAGLYTGTVALRRWENVGPYQWDVGETLVEAPFRVEVANVTFPTVAYDDTAVGLGGDPSFFRLNGMDPWAAEDAGARHALYKQYYDYLLDHKLNAYQIPYDVTDPRADAYMDDPRVKHFFLHFFGDDALLGEWYQKVQSKPEWASKHCFYPIDEPGSAEAIASYYAITDRLAQLCPGYHMVTPLNFWKFTDGREYDNLAIQNGRSDIICPISSLYDEPGFPEAVRARVAANGDRAWWYVCCGPTGDYCNMFVHQQGTRHRLLFWQQYQLGLTGLLYWQTTYWEKANPWLSSATWDSYESAGDGCWFYPGKPLGLDEPIPTLRLKNIADGLEDYDLLRMAEEVYGRAWVLERAAKLSASLTQYTGDPARLESVREEILRALAA